MTRVEGELCGHVEGIDDLGRVYVSTGSDYQLGAAADTRMYDIGEQRWSTITGLPQTPGQVHSISDITADGLGRRRR